MTAEKVYELADKAIELLNKKSVTRFNQCKKKLLIKNFDELNVINYFKTLYENLYKDALSVYTDLAEMVYEDSLEVKKKKEDEDFWEDWVLSEVLNVPDEVTKYIFTNEVDRKRDRAVEAINASTDKASEVAKALRWWVLGVTQYADNITDKARVKAFTDSGVEKVMWVTQRDPKVCGDCEPLDGQIFDIDKVPSKRHYRCRCFLVKVGKENEKDRT